MNHNLKRPCPKCPFRSDIAGYLTKARVTELEDVLLRQQGTFPCHQTVDYSDDSSGQVTRKSEMCAGAMVMLERMNRPTQMMRISERLGFYDALKLDMDSPVHASFSAMRKAQTRGRKPRPSKHPLGKPALKTGAPSDSIGGQ